MGEACGGYGTREQGLDAELDSFLREFDLECITAEGEAGGGKSASPPEVYVTSFASIQNMVGSYCEG